MIIEKTKSKHIDQLHSDHQLWASAIEFYEVDLKIYQNRLEEIASKNSGTEVRKQIEHFQNQFIIQKEQLDILNHEIHVHEQWLAKFAEENPLTIEEDVFADHSVMREQMQLFDKIFIELKNDFRNFLREWM